MDEGISYTVRVIAENEAGQSDPSPHCDAFTAAKAINAPKNLRVVEINLGSVNLEWDAPEESSGVIASYVIEQRQSPNGKWQKCNYEHVTKCEYECHGLVRMYSYDFRVTAKTNSGTLGVPSDVCGPILNKIVPEAPKVFINLPTVLPKDKTLRLQAGKCLELVAEFSGKPKPDAVWTRDGKNLAEDVRSTISCNRSSCVLLLDKVTREDRGEYKVKVTNDKGDAEAVVKVLVLDTPGKPEAPLEISAVTSNSCVLTWKPPLIDGGASVRGYVVSKCDTNKLLWTVVKEKWEGLSWKITKLIEGKEYVFRVSAINDNGTGPALLSTKLVPKNLFGKPDAPGKPEAIRIHINSITICYAASKNDGGSKIVGYNIERLKNRGSRWVKCNDEPVEDLTYRITGLSEGSSYEFRIFAVNEAGESAASETSPLIECRLPTTPPGPPCVVRLVDSSTTTATIVWEPPLNDNGGEITGYFVEKKNFDRSDTEQWYRVNETAVQKCEMVLEGLEDKKVYEVQVRAVNSAGTGEPCECCDFVKAVERPEQPEFEVGADFKSHISVHAGKKLKLSVRYNGRPEPDVAWLRLGSLPMNEDAKVMSDGDVAALTIPQAKREDRGKYQVTIQNQLGMKKITYSVKVFATPGPVGQITFKEVKIDSVLLNWTEPDLDGCSAVNEYIIEKREASSHRYTKVVSDCTRTFYKVTELEEGKSYVFRVTAVNEHGSGESTESEIIKATQVPYPPVYLELIEV